MRSETRTTHATYTPLNLLSKINYEEKFRFKVGFIRHRLLARRKSHFFLTFFISVAAGFFIGLLGEGPIRHEVIFENWSFASASKTAAFSTATAGLGLGPGEIGQNEEEDQTAAEKRLHRCETACEKETRQ